MAFFNKTSETLDVLHSLSAGNDIRKSKANAEISDYVKQTKDGLKKAKQNRKIINDMLEDAKHTYPQNQEVINNYKKKLADADAAVKDATDNYKHAQGVQKQYFKDLHNEYDNRGFGEGINIDKKLSQYHEMYSADIKNRLGAHPELYPQVTDSQATDSQATDSQATDSQATDSQATDSQATDSQATDSQATGNQATGNQATDNQATDNQATDNQATGNQATDNQATGNQATDNQATGDQATDNQATGNQATDNQATNGQQSGGFKRLTRAFYNRMFGLPNEYDIAAGTAGALSNDAMNAAANRGMEAQRAEQQASLNIYDEGDRRTFGAERAEDAQVLSKPGDTGTMTKSAARLRSVVAPDYNTTKAEQVQAQNIANEQREKSDKYQTEATTQQGDKLMWQVNARDDRENTETAEELSRGGESEQPGPGPQPEQPKETPAAQPEEAEPEPEPMPKGNAQHVINALLGSSEGEDLRKGDGGADQELYNWILKEYKVTPAPIYHYWEDSGHKPAKYEQLYLKDGNFGGDKAGAMEALRTGRAGSKEAAKSNFTIGSDEYNEMKKRQMDTNNLQSDTRVKKISDKRYYDMLSDLRMKQIRYDLDNFGRFSDKNDLFWLAHQLSKGSFNFNHEGKDYDVLSNDFWSEDNDSVLKAYADNIRNYVYTYKPIAQSVDPSIDTNEEHIGPMAQDIEQVNPACIKETPEGIKTVDTRRLSLMNAGAIGDIARMLEDLTDKVNQIYSRL